jgi:hypothetical protein
MKRALFLLPALLLLPVALASAASSLPKPADPLVVVPKSLAGVKIGMPASKARSAWGAGRGSCEEKSFYCEYGDSVGPQGYARIEFREGTKVSAVAIYAGTTKSGKITTKASGALPKIRTKEGLGLGSKYSAVKAAYKKGKLLGKTSDSVFYYEISGKAKQVMVFGIVGDTKKVTNIILHDGLSG